MKPRVLSLFSGIGGFDLGLERAGMQIVGQCELDPWCRKVLKKHWPETWVRSDVRRLTGEKVLKHCGKIDVLCGGYPCQPFSVAGLMKGEDDKRNLWPEMRRLIRELRPRIALLENVPGHLGLGFPRVCGELAALGYDIEWAVIPALALGAGHVRKRLFAVAWCSPDSDGIGQSQPKGHEQEKRGRPSHGATTPILADASGERLRRHRRPNDKRQELERTPAQTGSQRATDADMKRRKKCVTAAFPIFQAQLARRSDTTGGIWESEPRMVRMVHGFSGGVDRIRGLGNAVVPQVAEYVGQCVMERFFKEEQHG